MKETAIVAILWIAFAGSHAVLSSAALRPRLRAALGPARFLGAYTAVAFATFVPLVWYYLAHRHAGPWLWGPPSAPPVRWLLYAANAIAFVLIAAALMRPSPALVGAPAADAQPRGSHLLTRHGLFMGLAIWALAHLAANGWAADIAFYGGFAAFAILGAWHQDARKLADGDPAFARYHAATPFLPFTGRRTLEGLRTFPPAAVIAGLVVAAAARWAHRFLA